MARDRKRAKQRRGRRGPSVAPQSQPVRKDVPGALDHASGEVDEFDAALIRGAEGVPVAEDVLEDEVERDAQQASRSLSTGDSEPTALQGEGAQAGVAQPAPRRGLASRTIAFLRASWAEMQRVQWPDRVQVWQGTLVVIGFVVIVGLYLGAAGWVAQRIVNLIV
ncbi:MAG TPA: preprotein translocase subunit SecE [Solirubrobacteraceae bacterium]